MSKVNSEESSSGQKLLKEVETISEALYVNKNPRNSVAGPSNTPTKPLGRTRTHLAEPQKEKKSFWNWPLRALSHIRNRRFNCCFSAQVHSVEGLPSIFHDLYLTVHWKRRDESLTTRPAKVLNGRADFKDKLTHTCSVYGSRSGPHHSAKYEAKHFLLYVSLVGSPEVDLGKHRMDLTKLLPLTLEELQDEKSSGKWSTTFQLTGKANGATLSISFGYTVVGDTRNPASNAKQTSLTRTKSEKSSLGNGKSVSRRYNHGIVNKDSHPLSQNVEKFKDLHEILPGSQSDLVSSVNILYKKFDEEKVDPAAESQFEANEVPIAGSGEVGTENLPPEEGNKVSRKDEESVVPRDDVEVMEGERDLKETIMKDLESALKSVEMLETTVSEDEETCFITPIKETSCRDVAESVASEFLDMLGIEHIPFGPSFESEPESPRERLLREFERETLAAGSLFDFSIEADENFSKEYESDFEEGFDLASLVHDIEEEYQLETQARVSKPRAKLLEGLETESLMREWGMNENTFQNSPPPQNGRNAFLSEPFDLPPLGDGLGPVVQTKNGGFLRSMNPLLFRNSKAGGSLIMQVSSPVVVPAEMGSSIIEILERLATAGIEKLSMQANKVMPLDDITGKTMEEVSWETSPAIVDKPKTFDSSEYVSLEDLAPLAMDQIETLSLEGLRIQSGMSDEEDDATSEITAKSIGEISAFQGKSGCVGLEGAAGLQLLDIKDEGEDDEDEEDGLMGLSLTLDEWMKLDSGDIGDDEEEINERTSKILAAHHANPLPKGKKGRKCGLLGNNFTVALMVQLRDPLRNYEPVGAPMLSLIQVERLFVPPKATIYRTVSELRKTDDDEEEETMDPQYKISEVHLTGMKSESDKKQQVQSGSRWLMANGMGKGNNNKKLPLVKPKIGDKLWSVSGSGSKWKELGKIGVRNPNVIMRK